MSSLGTLFHQKYGIHLCSFDYGFQSITSMLEHFSDYFTVKGKKQKRTISLVSEMTGKQNLRLRLNFFIVVTSYKMLKH